MLKSKKITPENGCILTGYPNQNDVTFCAHLPDEGDVRKIVVAVRHDGKYLQDMEGASVKYHREKEESGMRNLATLSFPDGIPEDYLRKLESYQAEDFAVEYNEECIAEVE